MTEGRRLLMTMLSLLSPSSPALMKAISKLKAPNCLYFIFSPSDLYLPPGSCSSSLIQHLIYLFPSRLGWDRSLLTFSLHQMEPLDPAFGASKLKFFYNRSFWGARTPEVTAQLKEKWVTGSPRGPDRLWHWKWQTVALKWTCSKWQISISSPQNLHPLQSFHNSFLYCKSSVFRANCRVLGFLSSSILVKTLTGV